MTGTTARGLPYPDPTDPLAEGADVIKALALAVDGALTTSVNAMIGTFDPALPVHRRTGWTANGTDSLGVVRLGVPGGVTGIMSAHITPTRTAASEQDGWYPLIRLDASSLTSIAFTVMTAPGITVPSVFISYAFTIDYQSPTGLVVGELDPS
jgi:hypothetical protein